MIVNIVFGLVIVLCYGVKKILILDDGIMGYLVLVISLDEV